MKPLRGRLAPSPTGVLHLGNARSFLLAWLDVRSQGGELLLRMEDLAGPRIKAGATESALADLNWLGLDWDGTPTFQSKRLHLYKRALTQLASKGLIYPCVCTRKDVESASHAPHTGEEGPLYPGTCRGKWADAEQAFSETGREPCWRFQTDSTACVIQDRFLEERKWIPSSDLGDFVIWKKDSEPAYQLAVVVDDAAQGVTTVLRADDLFSSAARQHLLYQALELQSPTWAHTPLVVGQDGRRLAKRHGDTSLRHLKEIGVSSQQVIGLLAFWSGLIPEAAPCSLDDLLPIWDLGKVPRQTPVWDGRWS